MSKLISKKEVIDCLLHTIRELQRKNEETYVCNERVQRIHALKYAIHDIEAIPAADVQPVRHGRWIKCDYKKLDDAGGVQTYIGQGVYCSKCRTGFHKNDVKNWIGCPYCLTRMDGEENV